MFKLNGYYFITESRLSRSGNISDVRDALAAGVKVVQYRNKHSSTEEMFEEALKIRKICRNIIFLVNDRVDIALAVKADGVHIGKGDLPYNAARRLLGKNRIIGLTVHSVAEAKQARGSGADYVGVSPIFITKTKPDSGKPRGVSLIRKIKKSVSIPVAAIGGIDLTNAKEVIDAGADAICAISAVVTRPDVSKEIKKFQALFGA
ncbi:MAG: thiamine phosphate synthase [Candidatus Omnitrophica bacterium]|nr:thiamine phosphate synthase [Candidatus Omnitrophota bacterium]MDD5552273.1 thiamine phosphate synthase [Candidatus Omnitrophota bacterium]